MRWLAIPITAAGIGAELAAGHFGAWWAAAAVGFLIGLLLRPGQAAASAAVIGVLGWGLGLAWLQLTVGIASTARILAGIMGLGHLAAAAVGLTLLVGLLLTLTGAWVGAAIRGLLPRPRPRRPEDA